MKRLIVLMLVLGLAMPAQAWHLFPVRKEIVTVKETNYVVTAVTAVVGGLLFLVTAVMLIQKDRTLKTLLEENASLKKIQRKNVETIQALCENLHVVNRQFIERFGDEISHRIEENGFKTLYFIQVMKEESYLSEKQSDRDFINELRDRLEERDRIIDRLREGK